MIDLDLNKLLYDPDFFVKPYLQHIERELGSFDKTGFRGIEAATVLMVSKGINDLIAVDEFVNEHIGQHENSVKALFKTYQLLIK